MPYVRQPGETDDEWVKFHHGQESEDEWRDRATPPNHISPPPAPGDPPAVRAVPPEAKAAWQARIAPQKAGESYEDWRARNCQRYPAEPNFGYDKRKAAWLQANPAPGAAVAAPAPAPVQAGPPPPFDKVPAFSANAVSAEMEVRHARRGWDRKRFRLFYHFFPIAAGENKFVERAELERIIRLRTFRWVRRVFAQANFAPKIVGIDHLPTPPGNLLCVCGIKLPSHLTESKPSGQTRAGAASAISIVLRGPPELTVTVPLNAPAITSASDLDWPLRVADAIAAALTHAGFQTQQVFVPRSDPALPWSRDLFVKSGTGQPVAIKKVSHNDARMGPDAIAAPTLEGLKTENDTDLYGGGPAQRLVLRSGSDNDPANPMESRIDIYIVPEAQLKGRAYPDYREIADPNDKPDRPLRRAAYVGFSSGGQKTLGEDIELSPFTLAHEIDHVMADTAHNVAEGDLMNGGWSQNNSITAEKRIYSHPLYTGSQRMDTNSVVGEVFRVEQDMGEDLHTRCPPVTEAW